MYVLFPRGRRHVTTVCDCVAGHQSTGQIQPPSQNKQRIYETLYDISYKTETNRAVNDNTFPVSLCFQLQSYYRRCVSLVLAWLTSIHQSLMRHSVDGNTKRGINFTQDPQLENMRHKRIISPLTCNYQLAVSFDYYYGYINIFIICSNVQLTYP